MHEALRLGNLSKLPLSLRMLAKSAAAGSYDDLTILVIPFATYPPAQSALLLPVLFVHLDPAGIPTPPELDALLCGVGPEPGLRRVTAGTICLHAFVVLLNRSMVPATAYADLWTRLHPWIVFVETYSDFLPSKVNAIPQSYPTCIHIVTGLTRHPATSKLILASSGLRLMFAKYWAKIIRTGELRMHDDEVEDPRVWHDAWVIISFLGVDPSGENLEEILDGISGGMHDFADLLMKQIDLVVKRRPLIASTVGALIGVLNVVDEIGCVEGPLIESLLLRGFVKSLSSALIVLSERSHRQEFPPAVHMTLNLLMNLFRVPLGHKWFAQALDGGLLTVIVTVGVDPEGPITPIGNVSYLLVDLLKQLLPAYMMHYQVICQLKKHLHGAVVLAESPAFKSCSLYQAWKNFAAFTQDRLKALEFFDSGTWISSKACENMKCLKIAHKADFKSCSGCSFSYYCGRGCQRIDWDAGHRKCCRKLGSAVVQGPFTPRDRAFLRALLEYNFRHSVKLTVLIAQAEFVYMNPPGAEFFTEFDLTGIPKGMSWITVRRLLDCARAPEAPLRLDQVARSGRRMQLHTVILHNGAAAPIQRMLPVWSSSSQLLDGLHRIVGELPQGRKFTEIYPQVVRQLRKLTKECEANEVLEIY
ncbi:hypothetical protein FB451DRAFT_1272804 [Mycena latifolia]|nr:hypothetical protein FB451DRAFT_1272804 [Mycena latifolia]